MVITSLENDKVKKYRKLQKRKYREEYNQYIVEGMHLVMEAYKSGVIEEVILLEGEVISLDVPCVYVTSDVMNKISTMDTPSTIIALCNKKSNNKIIGDKILLLDELQDPGNLGTIIRSAAAFNVSTIILSENTVDLYNPKVLRATQGMFNYINIISMDAKEAIEEIKNRNIPVYGTNVECGSDVRELDNTSKNTYALIMGNEGNGVRSEIAKMCDKNLYISMNNNVESLNVAIATSILLYELGR